MPNRVRGDHETLPVVLRLRPMGHRPVNTAAMPMPTPLAAGASQMPAYREPAAEPYQTMRMAAESVPHRLPSMTTRPEERPQINGPQPPIQAKAPRSWPVSTGQVLAFCVSCVLVGGSLWMGWKWVLDRDRLETGNVAAAAAGGETKVTGEPHVVRIPVSMTGMPKSATSGRKQADETTPSIDTSDAAPSKPRKIPAPSTTAPASGSEERSVRSASSMYPQGSSTRPMFDSSVVPANGQVNVAANEFPPRTGEGRRPIIQATSVEPVGMPPATIVATVTDRGDEPLATETVDAERQAGANTPVASRPRPQYLNIERGPEPTKRRRTVEIKGPSNMPKARY